MEKQPSGDSTKKNNPVKKNPTGKKQEIAKTPNNQKSQKVVKKQVSAKPVTTIPEKEKPSKLYVRDQFYEELPFIQKINARKSLGIDIDSDKVRYVLVNRTKEDSQVLSWGVQKYPSEEKDRRKALQIALENVKAKVYKRGMVVNASIFSPEISSRQIILPEMKKTADLEQAIYHKNEADIQNFNEKAIWVYEILDRFESEDITKLRIQVIVAPEDVVNDNIRVFNAVGIEITNLIPRPSAIQAGYRKMVFRPGRDLLIDIGYDLTQMCFIKNGYVEFVRNVSIGSRNLEVTIHSNPEEDKSKAAGSKSSNADLQEHKPDEVRSRLLSRIKDLKTKQNPVLHTFFSEILRSLAFFQGKDVQQYIERIFVTGYGIRKESLLPYLKTRLNIPLFILTPQFEDRVQRTTEFGEFFSTLGTTSHDLTTSDILPKSYKSRFIFKKVNSALIILSIVLFTVLGFISKGQYKLLDTKKAAILASQKEYDRLNPVEGKYQEVQQLIEDVNEKNKELKSYIQTRPPIIEIMRLFSNEVPVTIRLERIDFIKINNDLIKKKFKNDYKFQIDIDGLVTSEMLMADVTLLNFMNHLEEINYFQKIELLNKLKEPDNKVMRFGLRLFL